MMTPDDVATQTTKSLFDSQGLSEHISNYVATHAHSPLALAFAIAVTKSALRKQIEDFDEMCEYADDLFQKMTKAGVIPEIRTWKTEPTNKKH